MKKSVLLITALLFSFSVFAQTEDEIKDWENKGMAAYEQNNYQDAILYFERAKDVLEKQKQNNNLEYGSLLVYISQCYYSLGDYPKAVEYGVKAIDIIKATYGENHPNYAYTLRNLAKYYSYLGDHSKAVKYATMAMEFYKNTPEEDNLSYAYSLLLLADYYTDFGDYSKAVEYEIKAMEIYKSLDNPLYTLTLKNLANYYSHLGDYVKAVEYGTMALEIIKTKYGKDDANLISNLASYHYTLGDYSKAADYFIKTKELYEKYSKKDEQYGDIIFSITSCFSKLGDYDKAVEYGNVAKEVLIMTIGENNDKFATLIDNIGLYYYNLGEYDKAVEYGTKAMEIFKATHGENNLDYAISVGNLARSQAALGNISKALNYNTKAMEITKNILGENDPRYATSIDNIGQLYSYLGDYDKAVEYGAKAMEIFKTTYGYDTDYAISLKNLADYLYHLDKYDKAIEYGTHALEVNKAIFGENFSDNKTILNNLAGCYSSLGNYSEAIRLETEALGIIKNNNGTENTEYAETLNLISSYYSDLKDYSEAIKYCTEAIEIYRKVLGTAHPYYAEALDDLGQIYYYDGNISEAIKLIAEALEINRKIKGKDHIEVAITLNYLGYLSFFNHNYSDAIKYGSEATDLYKKRLGPENPYYAESLGLLALYYNAIDENGQALNYCKESINITENYIFQQFKNHIANSRANFWAKKSVYFTDFFPSLFFSYQSQSGYTTDLYDKSALFAKGLLLTMEMEINKLILESGDEEALRMFEELRTQRLQLQKLYETPFAERHINVDSLEIEASRLENQLVQRSNVYGDFTRILRTTWKDVQTALGKDEIAVEFLSFNVLGTDSTIVAALTLRKDDPAPKFIPLFEQSQIEALDDSPALKRNTRDESKFRRTMHFIRPEFTDLIWKPLQEELNGIRRIYFSPAGILHSIGIEYLPGMERYDIRRLSTTREIIDLKVRGGNKRADYMMATLYGGIDYEASSINAKPMKENGDDVASDSISQSISASIHRALIDSLGLRGGTFEYLPGTLTEVENIKTSFEDKHRQVITGADATEASVQALSAHAPNILHIATHGFYYTEKEKKMMDARKLLTMDDDELGTADLEDKALTRSGMAFAGANKTLRDENNPMDSDDGILTAQEISKLDLRGLDLVVLSACETGMGDITQGEGVFGLQRGFKKAGVGTIVMSLWKVDDNATQMMMTQFYKNLCNGMDKHKALQEAQKHVRNFTDEKGENKYNYPHYWAGFIILD